MKIGTLHTQQDADKFCTQPEGERMAISDLRIKGLQLERMATGRAKWRLRFTAPNGRGRLCLTLGDASILSLADARQIAEKHLRDVALGIDPKLEREQTKAVPTFAQFITQQYLPHIKTYKRSWDTDDSLLRNHLLPRFGSRYLDEITRNDIQSLHQDRIACGSAIASANHLLTLLCYIFNLAMRWETPGIKTNPCKGIPMPEANNQRERYLSVEEAQRLYASLCQSESPMLAYIVPMLILTGARKREVLDARWEDFDLVRCLWRIPITKSGKARHVPLSDGAVQLLSTVPRKEDCPWAFANPKTGKPFVSIFYSWDTARKRAGLAEVRIHDLRHSFASLLVNAGRTLYEVQHILGHTQVKTTQRYAHLSQSTLRDAANEATRAVGSVMMPRLQA